MINLLRPEEENACYFEADTFKFNLFNENAYFVI